MNRALFISGGLLFPFFQLLTVRRFIRVFFSCPRKAPIRHGAWAVYYALSAALQFGGDIPPLARLVLNTGLLFMVSTLSCHSSLKNRCLFSLLLMAVWMMVEVIAVNVLFLLGTDGWGLDLAGAAISNMCMFAAAVLAGRCAKGEEHPELSWQYAAAVILIPSGTIYLMHHIFTIAGEYPQYSVFAVSSSLVLLMMNYTAFTVYEWMTKEAGAQKRSLLYGQELEFLSRQIREREASDRQIRRLHHDMKNHMTGLLGMIEEGSWEDAAEYIRSLLRESKGGSIRDVSRSGNPAVDAIVNGKYSQARSEGIRLEAGVFIPSDLPFRAGDLAIVFGNLLDNALEACRELGTGERWIILEASYQKEVLMVTVQNSCTERKKDKNGSFFTTKKNRQNHGLGLSSVNQAVEAYEGQLETEYGNGIFRATAVMYGSKGEK